MKHLILSDYHRPQYLQQIENKPRFLVKAPLCGAFTRNLGLVCSQSPVVTKFLVGLVAGCGVIFFGLTNHVSMSLAQINNPIYKPTAIASGVEVNDMLTDKDIPTGQKGFARDYTINVQKDERLEIAVNSGSFDTVLSLLDSKGEVVAENDDAVGDSTNSLIFFKIRQSGNYIVRVSSFGGSSGGKFTLRVNKLQIIK